jgi:hypothetical protein
VRPRSVSNRSVGVWNEEKSKKIRPPNMMAPRRGLRLSSKLDDFFCIYRPRIIIGVRYCAVAVQIFLTQMLR